MKQVSWVIVIVAGIEDELIPNLINACFWALFSTKGVLVAVVVVVVVAVGVVVVGVVVGGGTTGVVVAV